MQRMCVVVCECWQECESMSSRHMATAAVHHCHGLLAVTSVLSKASHTQVTPCEMQENI